MTGLFYRVHFQEVVDTSELEDGDDDGECDMDGDEDGEVDEDQETEEMMITINTDGEQPELLIGDVSENQA